MGEAGNALLDLGDRQGQDVARRRVDAVRAGAAEHQSVHVRALNGVAPVGRADGHQVGDRVVRLWHAQRGIELSQALLGDLGDEPSHPAEMGVDRHRRGPGGAGHPAGLQRVRALVVEQADGGVQHLIANAANTALSLRSHPCHLPIEGVPCQ